MMQRDVTNWFVVSPFLNIGSSEQSKIQRAFPNWFVVSLFLTTLGAWNCQK
jgi:hypothetical protein